MKMNPYLLFDNRCEEAFRFYRKCLGGEIVTMVTYGESPMASETPAERKSAILHARLDIGGNVLMGSDCPPGTFQKQQGFSISLLLDDPAETERVFHALAHGGTVQMPIEETFWAVLFGMLTDQFGIPWMVNCEKRA